MHQQQSSRRWTDNHKIRWREILIITYASSHTNNAWDKPNPQKKRTALGKSRELALGLCTRYKPHSTRHDGDFGETIFAAMINFDCDSIKV